ncbi:MAG: plasmid replication protein, CyRepA1 family [Cyanobacteria bacterium P01_G01_bin.38]
MVLKKIAQLYPQKLLASVTSGFAKKLPREHDSTSDEVNQREISPCPDHIEPAHWEELTLDSGISPAIAAANFRSLAGDEVLEHLTSHALGTLKGDAAQYATAPVRRIQKRYAPVIEGGWWCTGLRLVTDGLNVTTEPDDWGCFKPDTPRDGWKQTEQGQWQRTGKPVKYEHPIKTPTGLYILDRPDQPRYWETLAHSITPLMLTEGAKKTGCLLTHDYPTLGLPGITQWNIPKTRELIPQLQLFAQPGRTFYICFDQDTKRATRRAVAREIAKLSAALKRQQCNVRIIQWHPELGKGVDDLIVNHGPETFLSAYASAVSFESWGLRQQSVLSIEPNWVAPEGQKYLEADPAHPIPFSAEAKLWLLKAPKGTGKTEVIKRQVDAAHARGQRALVLTHRVQLTQNLSDRTGVLSIYEVVNGDWQDKGDAIAEVAAHGIGLCIQSAHPNSQAQFRAEEWKDALIIIDEAEQVIWEMLNSSTCRDNRVAILREFRTLMVEALSPESEGRVILADADLSDYTVDFVRNLGEQPHLEPWLALSTWREDGYECDSYDCPEDWLMQAEAALEQGQRLMVTTDSQREKGRFSSHSLEKRWRDKFPELKILRIDSETLQRKNHPAFGSMSILNSILVQYDIVICSPSVETGVSIDIEGHFDAVYGCYLGVLPENSVRQSLIRLREPVPRHIYVAQYGMGRIGGGETWYKALAQAQDKQVKTTLRLIFEAGCDDIESDFNKTATITWSKLAARINTGMGAYRDCVLQGLSDEGHHVTQIEKFEDGDARAQLQTELKIERHDRLRTKAVAVSIAPDLNPLEVEQMENARTVENEQQALSLKKASLQRRYQLETVTPDLFILDEYGWHSKLRLHYYLTEGRDYLCDRDRARVNALLAASGDGTAWAPDIRRATLSVKIAALEHFKIPQLLTLGEISNQTPEVIALHRAVQGHTSTIKQALGFRVNPKDTPVMVTRKFLDPIGFRLGKAHRVGPKGEQIRIYPLERVDDLSFEIGAQDIKYACDRDAVFAGWCDLDSAAEPQPETPVIEATEPVVTEESVVSAGNKDLITPVSDYHHQPPISDQLVNEVSLKLVEPIQPELPPTEQVCFEILQSCDCWGQYVSVYERVGSARMAVLWSRLTTEQQRRIWVLQSAPSSDHGRWQPGCS